MATEAGMLGDGCWTFGLAGGRSVSVSWDTQTMALPVPQLALFSCDKTHHITCV